MRVDSLERIAVFIDADNAQAAKMEDVLKDISTYGRIVIKRAYGNWAKPHLKPWEKEVKRFAIGTIQQFDFASGKNASDMALTIDAMELLYTGHYDGFVIVSSDSDFTTLAIKLHESGAFVIGYGNKLTVESFRNACDEFNYIEDLGSKREDGAEDTVLASNEEAEDDADKDDSELQEIGTNVNKSEMGDADEKCKEPVRVASSEVEPEVEAETKIEKANKADEAKENDGVNRSEGKEPAANQGISESELVNLLHIAEENYAGDDGFVNVSSAGTYIKRVYPDFSIKAMGYNKLPEYLRDKKEKFEVIERLGKGGVKLIMYRSK